MEDNEIILENENSATDKEIALAEKMAACMIKIWKLVIPFAAGWFLIMLGTSLMHYTVDIFAPGFICLLLGLIAIPLPTVMMVWSGVGLREAFSTEYFIETTYSDGHKTVDYDMTGNLTNKILILALAFLLGYVLTPIRMVIGIFAFMKAKRQLNVGKLQFKEDVWFPLAVAAGAFILSIVMNLIITGIADANYDKEQHTGDYTAEETETVVSGWKEAWKTLEFEYTLNGSYEEAGNICKIEIKKNGLDYTFTVGEAGSYDVLTGDTAYSKEEDSPIPFGTYTFEGGSWGSDAASLTDKQKELLESCKIEACLDKIMALDPILKNDNFMQKEGYDLIAYTETDGEEAEVHIEVFKDTGLPYRMFASGGYSDIYGIVSHNIMFE